MTSYLRLFSALYLFFSCSKEVIEPNVYSLQIRNTYFEDIDSVELSKIHIGKIKKDTISEVKFISRGTYVFSCITQSELMIAAEIDIQGLKERIIIKLNKKGQVKLE